MSLSTEQIAENWQEFRTRIDKYFPERAAKIQRMYDDLEDRALVAPASGVNHYHNAFDGGYIDHVLRVMDCTTKVYTNWGELGASLEGFTLEELLFAAMHHDLGKLGFPGEGNQVYIPNDSEWHRKNQGKMYKINPNNPFALVPDLSLWLLQNYDIPVTWNEHLAIRIHDGLYDDANKSYYISRGPDSKFHNNMAMILHQADYIAARIEYEVWRDSDKPNVAKKPRADKPSISANKLFEDLFGND